MPEGNIKQQVKYTMAGRKKECRRKTALHFSIFYGHLASFFFLPFEQGGPTNFVARPG